MPHVNLAFTMFIIITCRLRLGICSVLRHAFILQQIQGNSAYDECHFCVNLTLKDPSDTSFLT